MKFDMDNFHLSLYVSLLFSRHEPNNLSNQVTVIAIHQMKALF